MKILIDGNHKFLEFFIQTLSMLFFPEDVIFGAGSATGNYIKTEIFVNGADLRASSEIFFDGTVYMGEYRAQVGYPDKDTIKDAAGRAFFAAAGKYTGEMPPWGLHTGIRPSLSAERIYAECQNKDEIVARLMEKYLMKHEKAALCTDVYMNSRRILGGGYAESMKKGEFSLYISIPFCPSRCAYCSFVSFSGTKLLKTLPAYVDKLKDELLILSRTAERKGLTLKTVYVGGGTPTFLSEQQLCGVLGAVVSNFDFSGVTEFTVEAGRPDTMTKQKLRIIKDFGVDRISVNPQTINDRTLEKIGRAHSSADFYKAYETAKSLGFRVINTDMIMGLPGESAEDMLRTSNALIDISPQNITVHTMCKKRSSRIKTDGEFIIETAMGRETAVALEGVYGNLSSEGYIPYYIYKQKFTVSNLENTGFAREGTECMYNIYMMDEIQTVFGAGAGAITKIVSDGRIERIVNYKYPFEYLSNPLPIESEENGSKLSPL